MADVRTDVWTADPWAAPSAAPAAPPQGPRWWASVLAVLVGASGVVVRLLQLGDNARRAALVLVVAAVVWEVVSRVSAGRAWRWPALVAVAVAAELASAPSGGRAPALLLVASMLVADAALVEWRPLRSWPPRTERVASLAIFPLVAAQVAWYRTGAAVVMLGLLAAALVVVEGYHRAPVALDAADRSVRRAVGKVVDALAAAIVFVCAVPFLYLGGGLVRLGRAVTGRDRRRASTWQPVASDPVQDASVPFRSAPARVRGPRNAVAAVGLAAVVVCAVLVAQRLPAGTDQAAPVTSPGTTEPATVAPAVPTSAVPTSAPTAGQQLDLLAAVPYSQRPAYEGVPWADQLQRDQEFSLVPAKGVGYRNSDTSSRYVNVREGLRVTPAATCAGCPRRTVWLVGASSVFGIGQRDGGTVAAELQRLAAKDGIDLRVVNLGVVGWTSEQEATDLVARLRATDDPPDAVVQLDGFNDAMAATGRILQGKGDDPAPLRLDATGTLEALQRQDGLDPATTAAIAELAARSYGAAQDRMRAASSRAGADHLAFFQPDAFASPLQLAQVRGLYATVPGILQDRGLGSVLDATAAALTGRTVDLRQAFSATEAPVMLDVVHSNEAGAELLAARVYPSLRQSLA